MAGKNQVTLTFAGDSDQLEKAVARSTEATRTMESQVRSSSDRIGQSFGNSGRSADDYSGRLDRLGEAGGNTESQFLGLGAGISGVSSLLSGDLNAETAAMALADLGDSVEHTVVPWITKMGDGLGSMGTKLKESVSNAGGMTGSLKKLAPAMIGVASAAGALVIGWQAWQSEQAKGRQQIQETRQALEDAHGDITRLDDAFVTSRFEPWIEGLNDAGVTLDTLRSALSGNEEAIRAVEVASAGMGHAAGSQLRRMLQEGIDALDRENAVLAENEEFSGRAGESILTLGQATQDTAGDIERMNGALDRLLGRFLNSDESIMRQNELVLGLGEHWQQMADDYGAAAMSLDINTQAGIANRQMLNELFTASADTINVLREQGATSEELRGQWALDRAELSAVIERFRAAGIDVSQYDELLGNIDRRVNTNVSTTGASGARHSIHLLGAEILSLPDHRSISVGLNLLTSTFGIFAPRHHAGGVFHAPQGRSEGLAMLLDGERVTRPGQPGHDASRPIVINVHGSVIGGRDLARLVSDELRRGGYGGFR